jgi:hypothetical protein
MPPRNNRHPMVRLINQWKSAVWGYADGCSPMIGQLDYCQSTNDSNTRVPCSSSKYHLGGGEDGFRGFLEFFSNGRHFENLR